MAFSFPNAPSMSQVANGYTWDGQKWTLPFVPDATKLNVAGGQTTTGGFKTTPSHLGSVSGSLTPNPFLGNYQILNNVGAITMNVPASPCAIDILVWNAGTAGPITFSGYTVGAGKTGDALTTILGHLFIISIRKFDSSVSTYVIKALQ